jgi:putative transposase
MKNPFRYFDSSPEVIRLVVQMYVRYPLSLRNVEDLLAARGIDICHETVRLWWNRFGPIFAAEIRRKRVDSMRGCTLAMAPRRSLRKDHRRDALSMAGRGSRGRSA